MPPLVGLTGSCALTVTEADTAVAVGSGSVQVLATPRLLTLCEAATVSAVANQLEAGTTTVGVTIQLDHLAPSPIGTNVRTEATVESSIGRKLIFTVCAWDDERLVAAGKITRVVVDEAKFMGITT